MITLETVAEFLWCWDHIFFLETSEGNFIWSDPNYGGDNTIKPFNGTLNEYQEERDIGFVRQKGFHRIKEYCGEEVMFVKEE